MKWFYVLDDGATKAEAEETEFSLLVAQGRIRPETLVWREGMAEWMPCRQARPELYQGALTGGTLDSPPPEPQPAPYYQTPYNQPGMMQPGPMGPVNEPMAIFSLVSGILGLAPGVCCCLLGLPMSIVAIICGHMSLGKIRQSGGQLGGHGMAQAGLILGYIALAVIFGQIIFQIITSGFSAVTSGSTRFHMP